MPIIGKAARVRFPNSEEEWIVGANELILESEMIKLKFEKERREHADYLNPIIVAFEGGAKTPQAVAEKLGVPIIHVLSKFKLAKRLRFI
jgi:hypothetical protein